MKDSNRDHFKVVWLAGGLTRERLEEAKVAHRQIAGNTRKNRTALGPTNLMDNLEAFSDRCLYPLLLHPAQVVRFMLNSGEFRWGARFANPGKVHVYT